MAKEKAKKGEGWFTKEVFDWVDSLLFALIFFVILMTFVFMRFNVSGESMLPTLQNGDKLIAVHRAIKGGYEPKHGDIVTVKAPQLNDKIIIKRVIGVPGDSVKVFGDGRVVVNGEVLEENYINNSRNAPPSWDVPEKIPENYYFVMGDNRQNSLDSCHPSVGLVYKDQFLGKAFIRFHPVNTFGFLKAG